MALEDLPMGVVLRAPRNPVEVTLDLRGELQALGDCLRNLDVNQSNQDAPSLFLG